MLSQSYKSPLNTSQNFKYFVYFWFFEEISHEAFGLLFHPEDVFYLFQGLYPYFLEYPDYVDEGVVSQTSELAKSTQLVSKGISWGWAFLR